MEVAVFVPVPSVSWSFHGIRFSEQTLITDGKVDSLLRGIDGGIMVVGVAVPRYPGHLLLTAGLLWEASSWRGDALGKEEWEVVDRLTYLEVGSGISWTVVVLELLFWSGELFGLRCAQS